MIDFLLIYEHKARELDNLCLLAAELKKRGYTVEILNRFDFKKHNRYLLFNKPKVIGIVAAYQTRDLFNQAYQFTGKINKIINFRWEQVFSDESIKKGNNSVFIPHGLAKEIVHICWGGIPFKQLTNAGVKNAIITGPIQMDFLSENLIDFYKSKDKICETYNIFTSKILLYISSFTYASYNNEQLTYYQEFYGFNTFKRADNQRKLLKTTVEWLCHYLDQHADTTVIYRPHPAELDSEIISRAEKKYRNFRVIRNESVKQWIVVSDYITTCVSTSIVEAYFAKKKVSIIRPFAVENEIEPAIYKEARVCSSYQQFESELNDESISFPINENYIKDYYFTNDITPAYKNLANLFENIIKTSYYDFSDQNRYTFKILKSAVLAFVKYILIKFDKNRFIVNKVWPFTHLKSQIIEYDSFSKDIASDIEIENIISKLSKLTS